MMANVLFLYEFKYSFVYWILHSPKPNKKNKMKNMQIPSHFYPCDTSILQCIPLNITFKSEHVDHETSSADIFKRISLLEFIYIMPSQEKKKNIITINLATTAEPQTKPFLAPLYYRCSWETQHLARKDWCLWLFHLANKNYEPWKVLYVLFVALNSRVSLIHYNLQNSWGVVTAITSHCYCNLNNFAWSSPFWTVQYRFRFGAGCQLQYKDVSLNLRTIRY